MKNWQKALLGLTTAGGGAVLISKLAGAEEEEADVSFVDIRWD